MPASSADDVDESTPPLLQVLARRAVRSIVDVSLDALLFIPTGGRTLRSRR